MEAHETSIKSKLRFVYCTTTVGEWKETACSLIAHKNVFRYSFQHSGFILYQIHRKTSSNVSLFSSLNSRVCSWHSHKRLFAKKENKNQLSRFKILLRFSIFYVFSFRPPGIAANHRRSAWCSMLNAISFLNMKFINVSYPWSDSLPCTTSVVYSFTPPVITYGRPEKCVCVCTIF